MIDRWGGPVIFRCVVVRNGFRYRAGLWSVDLDDLPRVPRWLAGFRADDHLGGESVRAGLERYLAGRGIGLDGGRVRMLTAARVLGYRPEELLSVYWCHDRAGELVCTVAGVVEASGGRRFWLIPAGKDCCATPIDVSRTMSLPEPSGRLDLAVTVRRPGEAPLVTTVRGRAYPVTAGALARLSLVTAVTWIRLRGARRWARVTPVARPNRV